MMNKKHLIGEGFKHVFLMTLSLLCVFPFYWMIVGMTNSSADITMGKLTFGNKLAENVTNAFNYSNLWRAFGNSLLLAVIVTGIGLLICSIAGYAFVVFPSRGKEILFLALIASMMVPFAAKIIPMFRMFSKMGLLNNYLAIILPAMFQPLGVFLIRQQIQDFPQETLEAARLDGASEYRIYRSIVKPNLSSAIAAALILIFIDNWNIVDQAVIFLREPYQQPLSVYLCQILEEQPDIFYAASVFYAVPVLLIFLMGQDYLIQGISMSGVKA